VVSPGFKLDGEAEARAESGAYLGNITKSTMLETPPPGAGFTTDIDDLPAEAIWLAMIEIVSEEGLKNIVFCLNPFHCTTEEPVNPAPLIVREFTVVPATAEFGETYDMLGTAFSILNWTVPLVPPPGPGFEADTYA
jgi:hypothetical protein